MESAATPGVESVTSELTEEEELSSGSFSIMARSMSVCREVSFSTRSSPVTVTVVDAPPTSNLMIGETATEERTCTSAVNGEKPSRVRSEVIGVEG